MESIIGKMKKILKYLRRFESEKEDDRKEYRWRLEGEDIIAENLILWGDEQIDTGWLIMCSKRYGFIKWLDKEGFIDYDKSTYWINLYKDKRQIFPRSYEEIIMELSIQDEPLEYLYTILK